MNNFTMFYPNPQDVEYRIKEAGWKYVNNRAGDFAYANVTVIPVLFEYVAGLKRVPCMADSANYLWRAYTPPVKTDHDKRLAMDRTRKLVADFYRELHTFGLLSQSTFFGTVRYAKAEDIDLGVDYTAFLSLVLANFQHEENIGIQASMRYRWNDDEFTRLKHVRRVNRAAGARWDGPIYWLTNKTRSHMSIAGTWVFTPGHVQDLVEEITGQQNDAVAIRAEIFDA